MRVEFVVLGVLGLLNGGEFRNVNEQLNSPLDRCERPVTLLITCETAGALIPEMLIASGPAAGERQFNLSADDGVDLCGGDIAEELGTLLQAPVLIQNYRSDLIDVSRSLHHRQLFGELTRKWPAERQQQLIDVAYRPFRDAVETAIARVLQQFTFVIHLSVRSFASRQGGKRRRTDVGLLYDPVRRDELDLCTDWINDLYFAYPNLRVRRNYPRRGTADSLTKAMRGRFPEDQYMGIEVWVNRAWASRRVRLRDEAISQFADSLRRCIGVADVEAA